MQLGQFTVDIDKSLAEISVLQLAHDVSSEKRDKSGKWASGGSSDSKKKGFLQRRREKKEAKQEANSKLPLKKKAAKGAVIIGGAWAGQIAAIGLLAKHGAKAPIKHKHIAIASGVAGGAGAIVGGGAEVVKHAADKATKFSKKTKRNIKRVAAVGTVGYGASVITKSVIKAKQADRHFKIHERMLKNAKKLPAGPDQRDAIMRAKKFIRSPHEHRELIMKAARKYHGVKTVGERLKSVVATVARKIKPLKVVKTAGLLLDSAGCSAGGSTFSIASVVSSSPIKKTIKKFRKHKHKIPQHMAGFI